jgi:hypothetical protein
MSYKTLVLTIIFLMSGIACFTLVIPKSSMAAAPQPAVDYQKTADRLGWQFKPERFGPFQSTSQGTDGYIVRFEIDPDKGGLGISVCNGEKLVYDWRGNFASSFSISAGKLYYADYSAQATGGEVVAVDLKSRKQLWRTPLQGLGGEGHFNYANQIGIENAVDSIVIWGNESKGRYLEIKRASDGVTVGHHIFPFDESTPTTATTDGRR